MTESIYFWEVSRPLPQIKCSLVRMATENSVSDDNRTAVGQVKSVRRVPVSRSTMVIINYILVVHSSL